MLNTLKRMYNNLNIQQLDNQESIRPAMGLFKSSSPPMGTRIVYEPPPETPVFAESVDAIPPISIH